MRIVFANRVPDGKERLRNEIQLPEPRYSAYKPGRDSNVGVATREDRRRQSVIESSQTELQSRLMLAQSLPNAEFNPLPLPFHLTTLESRPASSEKMEVDSEEGLESRSPFSSPRELSSVGKGKLEDPFQFERGQSRERGRSESLIAMRLKGLAVLSRQQEGDGDGQ